LAQLVCTEALHVYRAIERHVGAWQWKLALTSFMSGPEGERAPAKTPRRVIVCTHSAVGVVSAHCGTSYSDTRQVSRSRPVDLRVVRGIELLHPEAELEDVLEGLVGPRLRLVGVEQHPFVVAGDLASGVGTQVTRRVVLRERVHAWLRRAVVVEADLVEATIGERVDVLERADRLAEGKLGRRAHARGRQGPTHPRVVRKSGRR